MSRKGSLALPDTHTPLDVEEEVLVGWAAIGKAIECHKDSAIARAALPVDPLPVEVDHKGRPFAYRTALRDWCRRQVHAWHSKALHRELEKVQAAWREKMRHKDRAQQKLDQALLNGQDIKIEGLGRPRRR